MNEFFSFMTSNVYFALMFFGFLFLLFCALLGGFDVGGHGDFDHDVGDHDFDTDHPDHDTDHSAKPDIDHDFDSGHGVGPSLFGFKMIMIYLFGFGFGGAIATIVFKLEPWPAFVWALISLVGWSFVGYYLIKVFYTQQSDSGVSLRNVVGTEAEVTTGIPEGENAVGEITAHVNGQSLAYVAVSDNNKAIEKGEKVRIIKIGEKAVVKKI